MQSFFDLAKYNNLSCFFFLNFVCYFNFITVPKDKEDSKENMEVIKPNNCLFLTLLKIFVPENTVKTTVNILFE